MALYMSGHPWIIDDGVAPNKPTDSAILSRLKHFQQQTCVHEDGAEGIYIEIYLVMFMKQ